MKIQKRFIQHKPNPGGYRGHAVYYWESELFWGCARTPAQARMQNTFYMSKPGYRRAQIAYKKLKKRQGT